MMNLKEYSSVRRWLDRVASSGIRSATTEKNYLITLGGFCKFAKKDPDVLIAERREHMKSTDELTRMQHEELLQSWQNYLETKKGLARGSVTTLCATVKSFYAANYHPLSIKSPKSWPTRERKVPTQEELRTMISTCRDIRSKAFIMFLAQTGISLNDSLTQVTYDKIKAEFETNMEPLHIPMIRTKVKAQYDTFLGRDGLDYLKQYLKTRDIKTGQPIFNLTSRNAEYMVNNASVKANLEPTVTPHKLRSFFSTRMKLSGCPDTQIEYWMGHTIPYRGAYFVPPVNEQRRLYKDYEFAINVR